MKRSKINAVIKDMEKLIKEHGFEIPPFCNWTPEEWKSKSHEYDEIRDNMLGWDITDYGLGRFDEVGFALITIQPYLYHDFHVEEGTGDVLLGEVSMCNDDENDNRFYEPIGRFPSIEEDEPAYRLLCNEYPAAKE